jgi:hypothetical protein
MALGQDEAAALSNFVDASYTNWNTEVNGGGGRFGGGRKRFHSETPPANYVCHRCGVGGHWIYNCPTNGNAEFDVKVVKAPVGIPLEKLVSTGEGTIVMPDGTVGDVLVDERELKQQSTTAAAKFKPKKAREIPIPEEMKCPICSKLINDAVLILCCQTSFCDNCIRNELIETGVCPKCKKEDMLCDDLVPNPALRKSIQNHIRAQLNPQASLALEGGKGDEKTKVEPDSAPEAATVPPQANVVGAGSLHQNTPNASSLRSEGAQVGVAPGTTSVPTSMSNPLQQDMNINNNKFQFQQARPLATSSSPQQPASGVSSNQRQDSQVKSKPRFKVNAFRIPSKRVVESDHTKVGPSGGQEKEGKGKQVLEILRGINRLLPDGPTTFFEEAFCMSHKPLSRGDFEYLQDDFAPKSKRPRGREGSYHHRPPVSREDDFGGSHNNNNYKRSKRDQQEGVSPLKPPPRPMKRGGARIIYDH